MIMCYSNTITNDKNLIFIIMTYLITYLFLIFNILFIYKYVSKYISRLKIKITKYNVGNY